MDLELQKKPGYKDKSKRKDAYDKNVTFYPLISPRLPLGYQIRNFLGPLSKLLQFFSPKALLVMSKNKLETKRKGIQRTICAPILSLFSDPCLKILVMRIFGNSLYKELQVGVNKLLSWLSSSCTNSSLCRVGVTII